MQGRMDRHKDRHAAILVIIAVALALLLFIAQEQWFEADDATRNRDREGMPDMPGSGDADLPGMRRTLRTALFQVPRFGNTSKALSNA